MDQPGSGADGGDRARLPPALPPPPPPPPLGWVPGATRGSAPAPSAGPVPGWVPGSAPEPAAPAGPVPGWVPGSAPGAPSGPRGTSGRTAAVVVLIIVAVVFGSNLVNAAIPYPQDPSVVDAGPGLPGEPSGPVEDPGPVPPGTPLAVGAGFTLSPPAGWTLVENDDGLTVLQKGGVLLIAGGTAWEGTAAELATLYRDSWFANGQFTGGEAQAVTVGDAIPAAAISYTGLAHGTRLDGVIVAASLGGTGLLLNAYGAPGSLDGVGDDLDAILASVRSWAQ